MSSRVSTLTLSQKKSRAERIVMLTAYDATFAAIFDATEAVDVLLVGDSLGMVIQGHQDTLPVRLEDVIYHTRAVARATKRAHVVGDMPFMSYQVSAEQALTSAGRLVQEGGAHAVKLEGGRTVTPQVRAIVNAGIPVMGHVGLTPQSVHALGGFKVQGRRPAEAEAILDDAVALQEAGCYAVVLEGVPRELAADITTELTIPTLGIGAGPECDGQVLVCYDMLGMNPGFTPKFLKRYANLHGEITRAVHDFAHEVQSGAFPADEHCFTMDARLVAKDGVRYGG